MRTPDRSRSSSRAGPTFPLVESKLHPPTLPVGVVTRRTLLERLLGPQDGALITVVAPAGYGKSTLLAQWAERKGTRVGWISADDRDNDPAVLLTYLTVALDRIEPLDPRMYRWLAPPGAGIADVTR